MSNSTPVLTIIKKEVSAANRAASAVKRTADEAKLPAIQVRHVKYKFERHYIRLACDFKNAAGKWKIHQKSIPPQESMPYDVWEQLILSIQESVAQYRETHHHSGCGESDPDNGNSGPESASGEDD